MRFHLFLVQGIAGDLSSRSANPPTVRVSVVTNILTKAAALRRCGIAIKFHISVLSCHPLVTADSHQGSLGLKFPQLRSTNPDF